MKARKRIIAAIMAAVFTILQTAGAMPMSQVEAASFVDAGSVNLLEHSDFEETDVPLTPHENGSKLNNWSNYLDATKLQVEVRFPYFQNYANFCTQKQSYVEFQHSLCVLILQDPYLHNTGKKYACHLHYFVHDAGVSSA